MTLYCANLYLIIMSILFTVEAKHHKHKDNSETNYTPNYYNRNPHLSIDAYGNCHTQDNRIFGRCIHYQYCQRAISAWNAQHIYPVSCYYNAYENVVCCPYEQALAPVMPYVNPLYPYWPSQQQSYNQPTTKAPNMEQRFNAGHHQQSERINEKECSDNYLPSLRRRQRDLSNIHSALNKSVEIMEEPITKVARTDTQVVGGTQTFDDQYPFMCALGWKSKLSSSHRSIQYNCGCVLIAPKYALTAAHCATLGGESPSVARLGGSNLDERRAEVIKVKSVTQHPNYVSELSYHDIAIIKLERNSRKIPACLWNVETLPQQQLTALGYGQTKFAGPSSNTLLQVQLNILNNQECSKHHKAEGNLQHGIGPGQICAGAPHRDTCQGDSGGPLLMQWYKQSTAVPYVVGLTSLGEGCAGRLPGIYTRISNYIDWIESTVWA